MYVVVFYADLVLRSGQITPTDMVVGSLGILMVIEGARRVLHGSAVLDESLPERVAAVPDPDFMRMLRRELTAVRRLLSGRQPTP